MNNNKKQIKRIGIDARFYGPGKGLGRYTKEVVDRILDMDTKNEYVIFLGLDSFDIFNTKNPKVKKVLVRARWYSVLEQIMMPYLILREKLDFMHFLHFNVPLICPTKYIVTIHDLILTKFPTPRASTLSPIFYKIKHLGYKMIIKSGIKNAQKVIAVSCFTKQEIINQFSISNDKIVVTYEGVSNDLMKLKAGDKSMSLGYNIRVPFLLYVGNAYPHKNLGGLVNIFSKIRKKYPDLSLVLVGKEDYFYKRLKTYVKDRDFTNIIFTGYVSDQDLAKIYSKALAYIFSSFCEGFGLPPLEAMNHGVPVLSSNKTCMPEILEDAALYFNPDKESDAIQKIIEIMENKDLREKLKIKGFAQVKKYSWDKCARQTFEIYVRE
ncbi:hypothetical protein A2331_04450 [Candidatus Falkowbacteria bacterium RIFOXYB2_FULL_34_18]|uniref:Glycosyl transferase family 1 n=1 Tax=Candidatus Falkowbacteria bacterium RIFOXYD2_FULL_34_120 TaxID=1798007 RepID=A0A1F5TM46_9BACT|nr:MAG: hypothetical protein A2331_04450 [Candidatus Falkowbacteria bacterium RIFOXYB2_FULL_34_18]OGF30286.1 MAG: hypothetical protein A2500_06830 [Candidatus Falkowbacteria bacterium RIFOXYC12_FULL_34_55]OGF37837.1 MAG: hypothetical protein A2466_03955 [Candidatus Falkowbacteria bacterium RIFOXYC2_FULL_34_220]OGF39598.1 MAG: hypothetical protein A2515_03670 [Candidatus Falkowbacteria bacterium RIFOXYD12_FULL_34_57]OGF40022.1 MAG: hypothetical protein A2531_07400 [Candidatus Falkowbacteria bact